ncbi:MAG: ATP-binding protein [Acidobacteria bacterium]|nr:MAG: ATP-binding protein [Acidobacteriota bacterium]
MKLPFLDRDDETRRLRRLIGRKQGAFGVLYGRRRCGKSRLLREVLPAGRSVYYVGDDRQAALQRRSVAAEIGRLLPGFDRVPYPDWDALFARWWAEAPSGAVLVLDELPALVAQSPELPSLLQRYLDGYDERRLHLLVAGSSQRMMQGLALDRAAPLFGRALEILKIGPLPAGWIRRALNLRAAAKAIEAYAVWGGIPRYWELAADHPDLATAVRALVLSPLGVLYEEPSRLLLDDLRDAAQAASILSLIGQGCHRAFEIAARLGKPATSISRPLQRLLEMGLIEREMPYGTSPRSSKRTLYKIADPFLRFWFRFVEPERSRLEAGKVAAVERTVRGGFSHHVGQAWEELARASVPRSEIFGRRWGPARRWWGAGLDRRPLEVDLVSESDDGRALLIGEVKWTAPGAAGRLLGELARKAERLPPAAGRELVLGLWLRAKARGKTGEHVITPQRVLTALR